MIRKATLLGVLLLSAAWMAAQATPSTNSQTDTTGQGTYSSQPSTTSPQGTQNSPGTAQSTATNPAGTTAVQDTLRSRRTALCQIAQPQSPNPANQPPR